MYKCFVMVITLLASVSGTHASTLSEPGFSEVLLANIPISSNSFGSMAIDSSGDIYTAAGWGNEIFKVTPGGDVSQFGTTGGSNALGVAIIGDTVFVGFDSGEIRSMDLTQASPSGAHLASVSGAAMGMAVAPAGFGAYGGQLVIGTYNGISIVHPTSGAVTVLVSTPGQPHSDVGFTQGGDLLAADYDSSQIVQVSDTGAESVFYAPVNAPDGMAIYPGTGEVYVASSSNNELIKIASDGLSSSVFATAAIFDGGWYVSPIRFSADATALYYGADSPMNIYQISGVASVLDEAPVPTLSTWALLLLAGLMGGVAFSRKRA